MPQLNFPAPGSLTAVQHVTSFGGFDLTPTFTYRYTNLLVWSEDLTNTTWYRRTGNSYITADLNTIGSYLYDDEPTLGFGVTVAKNVDNTFRLGIIANNYSWGQRISVVPNTTYTLSWYAKRVTAANVFYRLVDVNNSSNIVSATDYVGSLNANTFSRISVTFTTNNSCSTAEIYLLDTTTGSALGSIDIYGPQLELGSTATEYNSTQSLSYAALGLTSTSPGNTKTVSGGLTDYLDATYDFPPIINILGVNTITYETAAAHIFDLDIFTQNVITSSTKILYIPPQSFPPYAVGESIRLTNSITGNTTIYSVAACTTTTVTIQTDDAISEKFVILAKISSSIYSQDKIVADYSRRSWSLDTSTPRSNYYLSTYYGIPSRAVTLLGNDKPNYSWVDQRPSDQFTRSLTRSFATTPAPAIFRLTAPNETRIRNGVINNPLQILRGLSFRLDSLARNVHVLEKDVLKLRGIPGVIERAQTGKIQVILPRFFSDPVDKQFIKNLYFLRANIPAVRPGYDLGLKTSVYQQQVKFTLQSEVRDLNKDLTQFGAPVIFRNTSEVVITNFARTGTLATLFKWVKNQDDKLITPALEKTTFKRTQPVFSIETLYQFGQLGTDRTKLFPADRLNLFHKVENTRLIIPASRIASPISDAFITDQDFLVKKLYISVDTLDLSIESNRRQVYRIEANAVSITRNNLANITTVFKSSYAPAERLAIDILKPVFKTQFVNTNINLDAAGLGTDFQLSRQARVITVIRSDTVAEVKVQRTADSLQRKYQVLTSDRDTTLRRVARLGRLAMANVTMAISSHIERTYNQPITFRITPRFTGLVSDRQLARVNRAFINYKFSTLPNEGVRLRAGTINKPPIRISFISDNLYKTGNIISFTNINPVSTKWFVVNDAPLTASYGKLNKFIDEGFVQPPMQVIGQSGILNDLVQLYLDDNDILTLTAGNTTPTQSVTINPVVKIESPAVYFDGYRDFVESNVSGMLAFGPNATIEMMIRPMAATTLQVIASFWNNNFSFYNDKLDVYLNSDLQVCIGQVFPNGDAASPLTSAIELTQFCRTTKGLSTSFITHLAIVVQNSSLFVYFDGIQQSLTGSSQITPIGGNAQLRIAYAGASTPVWLTVDSIITIPNTVGGRSYVPIVAADPFGLPIRYSLQGSSTDVFIDPSTGYIFRSQAANSLIEVITPSFNVIASNGLTSATKSIRLRVVNEVIVEYLIVGGGGGGGADMGGGGGGGGFVTGNVALSTLDTHGVFIGAGGTGAIAGTRNPRGSNGGFSAIIAASDSSAFSNSYSVNFDTDTDVILTNYNVALYLTGDFTIECWIYPQATGGMLLNHGGGSGIAWASYEVVWDGVFVNFAASSANSGYDIGSETGVTGRIGQPTLNVWSHIAVTRTGNIYRGFLNGSLGYIQTLALAPYNTVTRGLAVGANYGTTWGVTPINTPTGYITNLRIVNGTSLYTANFVPSTTPLTSIANTAVLLCSTATITENRSNISFTITTTGNPQISTFNPFVGLSVKQAEIPYVVNRLVTNVAPIASNIGGRMYYTHTFAAGTTETVRVDQVGTDRIEVFMWGGGGAGGRPGGWSFGSPGGAGAAVRGELPLRTGNYVFVVGGGGIYTSPLGANGGGGIVSRNGVDNSYGGGGGGYSGIFYGYVDQSTALMVAGGGGGGGSSRAGSGQLGGGGGLMGQDGISAYDGLTSYRGRGASQSAPGVDADSNGANTLGYQGALQGGSPRTNTYGGAGGGGYFGGSGGGYAEANTMGGGGGGSSYLAPQIVNGVISSANYNTVGDASNTLRGSAGNAGAASAVGTGGVIVIRYPAEPFYNIQGGRIAQGGGAGATTHDIITTNTRAGNGASGGGASGQHANQGYGISGQGNQGGQSIGQWYPAGGGGAGSAGTSNPATGGAGLSSNILGTTYWWSGGGGGGGYSTWGGNGGIGGGGGGAPRSSTTSTTDGFGDRNGINFAANATVGTLVTQTNVPGGAGGINTGGGGGGGAHYNFTNQGGNGGSGMVIARYLGPQVFVGGNVTTLGNYTVHTFTTSGALAGQVFAVTSIGNLIVEGDSITYNVNTFRVNAGTVLYWTLNASGNVEASNLLGNVTSGSFVIGGDFQAGSGGFAIQTVQDATFNPSRSLVVDIRSVSPTGAVVATAAPVIVTETLPTASSNIIISTPTSVYNEGTPIIFTVNAAVANGTLIYWTLGGGTSSTVDFDVTSGTATFIANTTSVTVTPIIDSDTQLETVFLQLRARSLAGVIYKVSDTIYINSNSSATITASATAIPEDGTVTFTFNTVNIPDGINLYWENIGTSLASDFSDNRNNGNITVINNTASLVRTGVLDNLADGDKTLIVRARIGNIIGSIIATSPTVTIVDNGIISGVDFVMVGGGGGGGGARAGSNNGGGGGAGGFVEIFSLNLSKNLIYSVTVGTGGAGAPGGFNCTGAQNGTDSVFTGFGINYTAMGGGAGGGSCGAGGGASGGSGGGTNAYGGGTGLQFATYGYGYGNNGAASNQTGPGQAYSNYGGGGGAGSAGVVGSAGGAGGSGRANPFGSAAGMYSVLAGGGGSGSSSGAGGSGIGGAGGGTPGPGLDGTGSGGGGSSAATEAQGGKGGNGIFALRYLGTTALAVGGNVFLQNGYVYHVFNSSGNLTTSTITGTVTSNVASMNEGQTVTFTVNTTGILDGAMLYWQNFGTTNGVTDFVEGSNSGSFTINSNTGSFTINVVNDFVTEGSETIIVAIKVLLAGSNICVSSPVTVVDTTTNASISITGNPTSVYEGGSLTYTITAPGAANGTVLYWTNNGTTTAADFVENVNSGSVVINSNVASFSLSPVLDAGGEGNETVVINVRRGSITGTVICTSSSVTVIDATYTIVPNTNSVNEGGAVTFTVTTANVQPGTYYWTNAGTTDASDFTSGANSGNITVVGTAASATADITLTTASNSGDAVIETVILQLRSYSTSGTVLATSSTVNVLDPFYNLEYIVVAGGGGGGRDIGGGGGAGGFLSGTAGLFRGRTYTISVGGGGSGSTSTSSRGSNGSNSSISGLGFNTTALGGGGGGSRKNSGGGASGGSGGGGAIFDNVAGSTSAGAGTAGQGNDGAGGNGDFTNGNGGGGGGAGQTGQAYNVTNGSAGGNGNGNFSTWISHIFNGGGVVVGKDGYFAGGGGGGGFTASSRKTPGIGGLGGGATASSDGNNGPDGTAYTGGGGAGQSSSGAGQGGAGGSGVVILRSASNIATVGGSGQIIVNGGFYYYVFLSGGTIVIN